MRLIYLILIFIASIIFAEKNHDSHEHHGHAVHQNDVYVDGKNYKLDKERFDKFKKNLNNVQVAIINVQGMVCDFCARGIEKAFLKDTKVKKIDVDLENGKVVIAFSLDKKIEFEEIKEKILMNGQNATDYNLIKI
jgi:copper chaperone CopZ